MTEKKQSLVVRTGERFGVDADKLLVTLKSTAFKQKDTPVTNEQMMALLHVCEKYDLDPFVNQIYAFPSKAGGIVPVVGVDGWLQMINRHPKFEGMDIEEADETTTLPGAKECPIWMEVRIHVEGRKSPVVVREYLDEVYRPPITKDGRTFEGPWQTHTKRMLRHKTIIQAGRVAFGLSGIYDEDEAERVLEAQKQAIDAEIIPEIEDAEGKFKAFLGKGGVSDVDGPALVKYLEETAAAAQLTGEELIRNYVVSFTADKKEVKNFVESFRSWQEKNVDEPNVAKRDFEGNRKRELVAELDEMISAVEDDSKVDEVLKKHGLEIGKLSVGDVKVLEEVRQEINSLIDKQMNLL